MPIVRQRVLEVLPPTFQVLLDASWLSFLVSCTVNCRLCAYNAPLLCECSLCFCPLRSRDPGRRRLSGAYWLSWELLTNLCPCALDALDTMEILDPDPAEQSAWHEKPGQFHSIPSPDEYLWIPLDPLGQLRYTLCHDLQVVRSEDLPADMQLAMPRARGAIGPIGACRIKTTPPHHPHP